MGQLKLINDDAVKSFTMATGLVAQKVRRGAQTKNRRLTLSVPILSCLTTAAILSRDVPRSFITKAIVLLAFYAVTCPRTSANAN